MIQFVPVPIAVGKQVNVRARNWMPMLLYTCKFDLNRPKVCYYFTTLKLVDQKLKSYTMYKLAIRFWVKQVTKMWLKIATFFV